MCGEITFNTAKLAVKKGFVHGTAQQLGGHQYNYYNDDGSTGQIGWGHFHQKKPALCPQSILQKWFREEHDIFVSCSYSRTSGYDCIIDFNESFTLVGYQKSYEEALEKGLYRALKLIKNDEEV